MKYAIALTALLAFAACYEKTESQTSADSTATVQTTTTETSTYGVDTAAAGTAIDQAQETAQDAAHKTGTALEKAGQEIQGEAKEEKEEERKKPPV